MSARRAPLLTRLGWRLQALLWRSAMGLFAVLPIETASALGGRALRLLGPLLPAHRTALINAKLCFPDLDDDGAQALAMAAWDNLGRLGGEFVHLRELRPFAPDGRVEVRGLEHLQAVRESGKPAVIVTGHFANWEVMAATICLGGLRARVSYRHANNPFIDAHITRMRHAYGVPDLSAKNEAGVREMVLALQKGQSVTFLNDQHFTLGVEAPFFGHMLKTAPGPARLARRFGAPILPVSVTRKPKARFVVTFHPPFAADKNPDKTIAIANTVARINGFLEAQIRAHPQDWFWVHRRWPKALYRQRDGSSASAD